ERNLLAVDLRGVGRAGKGQVDAPENERDGDQAEDDDDDRTAEPVTYFLQHGSPEKVSDTSSGKMSRKKVFDTIFPGEKASGTFFPGPSPEGGKTKDRSRPGAPEKKSALCFKTTGGVDGTRTRDPRRDRPVF